MSGFAVLPRGLVVERAFCSLGNRRLVKDLGNLAKPVATCATLASIQLALGRLVRA